MNWGRYIGLPFELHGRGPDAYDCWGLVGFLYAEELSILLPTYMYDLGTEQLALDFAKEDGHWREADSPTGYDVVLMRAMGKPHVGIVVDGQRMLHLPESGTACIESFYSPRWKSRVEGFYRYR